MFGLKVAAPSDEEQVAAMVLTIVACGPSELPMVNVSVVKQVGSLALVIVTVTVPAARLLISLLILKLGFQIKV